MALPTDIIDVPVGVGLDTKTDPRLIAPGAVPVSKNLDYVKSGAVQKRRPTRAMTTDTAAGGTVSDLRRVVPYGDELLLFTDDKIYSYSESGTEWVERDDYSAPLVTEKTVYSQPGTQQNQDRVELGGVAVYVWQDVELTSLSAQKSFIAAFDTETGAVLLSPQEVAEDVESMRLRATSTRIYLVYLDIFGAVKAKVLDPSDLATGLAASFSTVQASAQSFAVSELRASADNYLLILSADPVGSNEYYLNTVNDAGSVGTTITKAYDAYAVDITAWDGGWAIIRGTTTDIRVDQITSGLADDNMDVLVGAATDPRVVTMVEDASHTLHCFMTENTVNPEPTYNTVTSAGTPGTESDLPGYLLVSSEAFLYNDTPHCWMAFKEDSTVRTDADTDSFATQPNYQLISVTGGVAVPVAVAAKDRGGDSYGHLASVQNVSGNKFTMAGVIRRRTVANPNSPYEYIDGAIQEISVELDSDAARRAVLAGETLYISGGQVSQFDGTRVTELGFHTYTWGLSAVVTGAGSLEAGTYSWLCTLRSENAKGESESSTTASQHTRLVAASKDSDITLRNYTATRKAQGATMEVYRTVKNAGLDSPYYLVTSADPSNDSGSNKYVSNDPTELTQAFTDNAVDSGITSSKQYEGPPTLGNLAPPGASVVAENNSRVYLAGVSGYPHRVWYSKARDIGEVAAFSDLLVIDLPTTGGDITGLSFLGNVLVVFKETAIYAYSGSGFDNNGGGQNFADPQLVSTDVGATSHDLIARTPEGVVFFSSKGWFQLDRGFSVRYIGQPVEEYNTDTWKSVHVLEGEHQVRCLSSSRLLVYDTNAGAWSEWSYENGAHGCLWKGRYVYVDGTADTVRIEDVSGSFVETVVGEGFSMQWESPWVNVAGLQGFQRVKELAILAEHRSPFQMKIELLRDYDDETVFQTTTETQATGTVGAPIRFRVKPKIQKVTALKIRITELSTNGDASLEEGFRLSGVALEVAVRRSLQRLGAAQSA